MARKIEGLRRSVLISAGAFLAYGAWAAYANWEYGLRAYLAAALTQGVISFLVTASLTLTMENVFCRINASAPRFIATALGPQIVVATVTATSHHLVGTPQVLVTMAPSLIIGTVFCILYTAGLHARDRQLARAALCSQQTSYN